MTLGFSLKPNPGWQGHLLSNKHIRAHVDGRVDLFDVEPTLEVPPSV